MPEQRRSSRSGEKSRQISSDARRSSGGAKQKRPSKAGPSRRSFDDRSTPMETKVPGTRKEVRSKNLGGSNMRSGPRHSIEGERAGIKWVIFFDTPLSHANARMQIVNGIETWESDDQTHLPGCAPRTQPALARPRESREGTTTKNKRKSERSSLRGHAAVSGDRDGKTKKKTVRKPARCSFPKRFPAAAASQSTQDAKNRTSVELNRHESSSVGFVVKPKEGTGITGESKGDDSESVSSEDGDRGYLGKQQGIIAQSKTRALQKLEDAQDQSFQSIDQSIDPMAGFMPRVLMGDTLESDSNHSGGLFSLTQQEFHDSGKDCCTPSRSQLRTSGKGYDFERTLQTPSSASNTSSSSGRKSQRIVMESSQRRLSSLRGLGQGPFRSSLATEVDSPGISDPSRAMCREPTGDQGPDTFVSNQQLLLSVPSITSSGTETSSSAYTFGTPGNSGGLHSSDFMQLDLAAKDGVQVFKDGEIPPPDSDSEFDEDFDFAGLVHSASTRQGRR